jgi:hypothetical protein
MSRQAIENLRECQRQLDADGCEVGVSRQALDETLTALDYAVAILRAIASGSAGQDADAFAKAGLDLVELGERGAAEMRGDA